MNTVPAEKIISRFQIQPSLYNQLTNAAGTLIGVPDIMEGVTYAMAGDYLTGMWKIGKGLIEFVAFYFMGK